MLRLCKACLKYSEWDASSKVSSKASGFHGTKCWACHLIHNKTVLANAGTKYRGTPENKAKKVAASKVWRQNNRGKSNAIAMRRYVAKLQRVPLWADLNAVTQVYIEAAAKGLTVDHIYPLRGKLVSGLHIANNLQLLTLSENSKKGSNMPNV